jgi:hypothetical protein
MSEKKMVVDTAEITERIVDVTLEDDDLFTVTVR